MIDSFNNYPIDEEINVVLVGLDDSFTYTKLCLSSLYVQTAKAKFICTNEVPFINLKNGLKYPGTGSIVEAIQLTLNNEHGS